MTAFRLKLIATLLVFNSFTSLAQNHDFTSVSASLHPREAGKVFDGDRSTGWKLGGKELDTDQHLLFTLSTPGDVNKVLLRIIGISKATLKNSIRLFVTYDPMNLGESITYDVSGNTDFILNFPAKYGAHLKVQLLGGRIKKAISINEIALEYTKEISQPVDVTGHERPWLNPQMPLEERVKNLMDVMTPEDKMELLREGWGIPGIPHLGVPFLNKVEAIHGFSYGSGATIFPQSIGLGATWNKKLIEEVAGVIADETVSAKTVQAWSPVLDVAQDARWGRCEETYGEDPTLVSEIGGAWIKGFQSRDLFATPKHFAAHGAPLGGRDSHDIGLSEREMREIHLVPFRHVIQKYKCQSVMESYSDYLGVPVAKSKELLQGILREEWGFDGFVVSDCGALGNLMSRKHYTAIDYVEAANQSLAAGVATNCGDTYNHKKVIEAAKNGQLDQVALDRVCQGMLRMMFRNGFFDYNRAEPLDWNKIYPGWNSPAHKKVAHRAALESMVLLENKQDILPLSKTANTIAVIGPGADDLQPGDYTAKLQPGQLKSVLSGIKSSVGKGTKVNYAKGCAFVSSGETDIESAVKTALASEVTVLVLGDRSTSESIKEARKTSGEGNDHATLILSGDQQKLLQAICKTGKPVILVLQAGRPYNLTYASKHCQAILVNWLPGQEGGPATADVLFGDYNPAGRLPMTFPRHVGQLPLYYNFKTSGRGYHYVDMDFYPLYSFGYGLSYTKFNYSDLKTMVDKNGVITVIAKITNTGTVAGDEVVQLYVTDMYASVKTRIMELKDFTRITLSAGESKEVTFRLTPYQLSLLNDQMDRVVEPGTFKIMVGGRSPSFIAHDRIKDSVGFRTPRDGVIGVLNYDSSFMADFTLTFQRFVTKQNGEGMSVFVKVKNEGTLTDVGKIKMYADGIQKGTQHFELQPKQEKIIQFELPNTNLNQVAATSKYKYISHRF
ncbi:beta-glucosidase [Fulvivirga sp. M361]|uniref:glycoside hydrolase family 3 C-terminal domain-containing protein n=1 Tax=Fulvivirga sp. M361 TaxID=2594266 RepID=UPI00117B9F07|nr:glycoside hydrolase family 3 N-terminal domain-containing protein [Fulvivirga sp. M361]TRX60168.1 beta-glucosidase [Fulvivirga sp. M361]